MTIIEKLKQERIEARKNKDNALSSFFALVISEVEKIGKDAGNRLTTEDESVRVIEKTIGNIEQNMVVTSDVIKNELAMQISILKKYIPEKVSEDVVRQFIVDLYKDNPDINKGIFMKELKGKFGSSVDMKVTGSIVDEVLNNG